MDIILCSDWSFQRVHSFGTQTNKLEVRKYVGRDEQTKRTNERNKEGKKEKKLADRQARLDLNAQTGREG